MEKLILTTCGILLVGVAIIFNVANVPNPKVKSPDPRYSAAAISTATIKDIQDFTVLISNENMVERWRGTGVLLSSTTVLTCAHIIPSDKSTKTLWIYPYPGAQVVRAKLKFINYPKDLALLELATPVLNHKTPVFAAKVEIGEPIVSVGNIRGYMMWFASYGIISGEHGRWVLTDAMIRGGNSGGPWANAKGEIVALTDVGWEDGESAIAGGIPVQDLQEFLAHSRLKKPDAIYALTGE
jgi:S1-C subfamily serine protease